MKKVKTQFACSACGATSPKWIGHCPSCDAWNTYQEEAVVQPAKRMTRHTWPIDGPAIGTSKPIHISKIESYKVTRAGTKDKEFDRVMGGGMVPGSITLIGGDPGIGKSTLLLQVVLNWSGTALYVSGEESAQQIKMRADRLGKKTSDTFILAETSVESVLIEAKSLDPSLLVIDSIQTMFTGMLESVPGSVSQVRECTTILQRYAKETNVPVIIIGHINKEGSLAGPKVLEHIVDTVLQFEGDSHYVFRLLRTKKNRFGSTDELGIYEMQQGGLQIVSNPSKVLLGQGNAGSSGNAVGATLEGLRPIMIETQALVSGAVYGTPQR
ncbi:MAG: DNA repair protein RadA, partial [Saprospiraceae bacterium]|nr:DNA repair protein RadA [Saprospiraceae bacterium]